MGLRFAYLIEPPFNYRTTRGVLTGCDIELAKSVLGTLGIIDVEFVETEFASLLPGLVNGRWEMTTGLFITEERRRSASFSRSIWALRDGLLVRRGNPLGLLGYRCIAQNRHCRLAIIRGQIQHQSAIALGVPDDRISIFESYNEAAQAVLAGTVDAYASVAQAHAGFVTLNQDLELEGIAVTSEEKAPAFGAFAFAQSDRELQGGVDDVLAKFLGSAEHRALMAEFGFTDAEIDLVSVDRP